VGDGARNRYLVGFLIVAGAFFVLPVPLRELAAGCRGLADRPLSDRVRVLFALWLYAFVRWITRQRSGPGDDITRERGSALDRVIEQDGRSVPAGSPPPPA